MEPRDRSSEIRKWLQNTGYPLELRVAGEFRSDRSLLIAQSVTYRDVTDQTKLREADVSVEVIDRFRSGGMWNLSLVIECKHAKDGKPWIAFTNGSTLPTWADYLDFTTVRNRGDIEAVRCLQTAWAASPLFSGTPTAFGIVTAHTSYEQNNRASRNNPAGDALDQALSAAAGLSAEFIQSPGQPNSDVSVYMPMIVTTAELYSYQLKNGTETINKISHVAVRTRHPNVGTKFVIAMTEDHFRTVAAPRISELRTLIER